MKRVKRCSCEKDVDGQCAACRVEIVRGTAIFGNVLREFIESVESFRAELDRKVAELRVELDRKVEDVRNKEVCRQCSKRYADLGIAKMLLSMKGVDRSVLQYILNGTVKGLKKWSLKWPLTEKAWKDICAQNGWKE